MGANYLYIRNSLLYGAVVAHRAILYCNHYTQVYSRDQVPAYGVLLCLLSRSTTSNYSRNSALMVLLYPLIFLRGPVTSGV